MTSKFYGDPPIMKTGEDVRAAGPEAIFINPFGQVFRSFDGIDGHRYLRPLNSGDAAYRIGDLYRRGQPGQLVVGLRLVYGEQGTEWTDEQSQAASD